MLVVTFDVLTCQNVDATRPRIFVGLRMFQHDVSMGLDTVGSGYRQLRHRWYAIKQKTKVTENIRAYFVQDHDNKLNSLYRIPALLRDDLAFRQASTSTRCLNAYQVVLDLIELKSTSLHRGVTIWPIERVTRELFRGEKILLHNPNQIFEVTSKYPLLLCCYYA